MKVSPTLIAALAEVASRLSAIERGSISGILRDELARVFESYREETDDFGDLGSQSAPFAGYRAPDPDRIRDRMAALGLSQRDLALRLGISQPALSKSLSAPRWSFDRFEKFSIALGLRVDDMILSGDLCLGCGTPVAPPWSKNPPAPIRCKSCRRCPSCCSCLNRAS